MVISPERGQQFNIHSPFPGMLKHGFSQRQVLFRVAPSPGTVPGPGTGSCYFNLLVFLQRQPSPIMGVDTPEMQRNV